MTIREIQDYIERRKREIANSPRRGETDKQKNSGAYEELLAFSKWLKNNATK